MKTSSYHIIRVSLGITFLWVGILIFRDPVYWSGFLDTWMIDLIVIPLSTFMISVAVLDVILGLLLLIDYHAWIAGFLAAVHMALVLITSGIDEVTVRDIGLLGAGLAVFWTDMPNAFKLSLKKKAHTTES